ncbi:MAG: VCBS repeat-containing protein [Gammaproteobacteria bacterium]|nr:VCBS repeat-containing protein [Gammaproteobacteria bacterium]
MFLTAPAAFADDEVFEVTELPTVGRVVTAQFADFDGDGAKDLMLVTLEGIPPEQTRTIHVYRQSPAGGFSDTPTHSVAVPDWSAVYDVADIRETPGDELLLLRPDRVTVLSLAEADGPRWEWPVDGPTTLGAGDDERGFERFRLVYDDFDDEPWIIVPQLGAISALSADGELLARLAVGRRANYFVASGGELLSIESDIQLYFDAPKISVGDIDGDGRVDILAATRHELRVFLRDADGGFPAEASYSRSLGLIDEVDFTRGSGSVVTSARDIDADGRLDLMISHIEGSMVSTATTTRIFFNHDGGWNLTAPDDEFSVDGSVTSALLMNIDRDDALELVRIQVKFSIFEMVEMLLTREVDTQIMIHRLQADGRFGEEPWSRKKIGTKISFDTFRPRGFMPRAGIDLNADGLMDFVSSDNGKGIEVFLGGDDGPFSRRTALQKMPTAGIIHVDDINGDAMDDFVLFDPQSSDATVRIGLNHGTLETRP